ncbi:MAG TPA: arginase family protein, partial [Chitinophagales bacterium]|nr:arginase family protein [Chitinophagales bacterium]
MTEFNPNGVGIKNGHIFSLPYSYQEAKLVLLPVPWEVTVSYNAGTANAPEAILEASSQLDLFDAHAENEFLNGIYMLKISDEWKQKNKKFRIKANEYIKLLESGADLS